MEDAAGKTTALIANIEKVIVGKREVVEQALISFFAAGHLLIEDAPGMGKTMLARAISKSVGVKFRRIQFTPDLLPSDITGVSIYNQKSAEFEFRHGPVFTNILLADEINRAPPRTQSSLLECMQEGQVTADGITYALGGPFFVIATQNPIELHGTYPLPEAQLDRFLMKISVGYPSTEEEIHIMNMQTKDHPINSIDTVWSAADVDASCRAVRNVYIDDVVKRYIAELTKRTRNYPDVVLGASPRGSLALMRASQSMAFIRGKDYVDPVFIKLLAKPILCHRILLSPQARMSGVTPERVVEEILNDTEAPVGIGYGR